MSDLETFMHVMRRDGKNSLFALEAGRVPRGAWDRQEYARFASGGKKKMKLRVGYVTTDHFFDMCPSSKR